MECISIIASWICTYMHVRWFIVIINKKKVENGAVLISYTIYTFGSQWLICDKENSGKRNQTKCLHLRRN